MTLAKPSHAHVSINHIDQYSYANRTSVSLSRCVVVDAKCYVTETILYKL